MVIARLIDGDGVDRGMHNFLVPLRSMNDHKLLSGVTTGDIGPKIGYNNMDNGFARFENVLIPRRNMAMRFATVDETGKYNKKTVSDAASKVSYITMMQVRSFIVDAAGMNLAMACTVSIRYSAVRKQGFDADDNTNKDGKQREVQIIDYRQQQHRLFPLLAASYCFFFTGKRLLHQLQIMEQSLVSGQGDITKEEVADVHASSSSLKSFTTMITADGIEECRKACGGHGFLQSSGLPELATTYLQNPTVEGDNYMLPQQVIKVLLKLVQAVQSGDEEEISKYQKCDSSYLISPLQTIFTGENTKPDQFLAKTEKDVEDLNVLLHAFSHRSARMLVEVAKQLNKDLTSGRTMQTAWNDALVLMMRSSRAHALYILLRNFMTGVEEETSKSNSILGQAETAVIKDLAVLFGLYWIERDMGDFLEDGYLSAHHVRWIRRGVIKMLTKIRPNAVALVDARDFSDFRLKSALGRWDGDVYPAVMRAAKKDPLNASEPGPGYEEHLKRLIVGGVGKYTGTVARL
uniref:acyl-CoA oxidase n=1 Tax=Helicotheca tamesis TaxID=374047 RepID=A0A6U0E7H6_9STRA